MHSVQLNAAQITETLGGVLIGATIDGGQHNVVVKHEFINDRLGQRDAAHYEQAVRDNLQLIESLVLRKLSKGVDPRRINISTSDF